MYVSYKEKKDLIFTKKSWWFWLQLYILERIWEILYDSSWFNKSSNMILKFEKKKENKV